MTESRIARRCRAIRRDSDNPAGVHRPPVTSPWHSRPRIGTLNPKPYTLHRRNPGKHSRDWRFTPYLAPKEARPYEDFQRRSTQIRRGRLPASRASEQTGKPVWIVAARATAASSPTHESRRDSASQQMHSQEPPRASARLASRPTKLRV